MPPAICDPDRIWRNSKQPSVQCDLMSLHLRWVTCYHESCLRVAMSYAFGSMAYWAKVARQDFRHIIKRLRVILKAPRIMKGTHFDELLA